MTRKSTLINPLAIALITGFTLVGCSEQNSSGAAPQSAPDASHDHEHGDDTHTHGDSNREPDTYTGIRGEIKQMIDPQVPSSELKIHHQQIANFKTMDGTVNVNARGIAGMMSMTMPFPVAQGVSLEGFNEGDKVSFDFVVNWGNDRPAWEITKIEKLPADTEIDYTNAIEEIVDDAADAAKGILNHDDHDHDHGDDHDHDGP